jgi:hypothetical protein
VVATAFAACLKLAILLEKVVDIMSAIIQFVSVGCGCVAGALARVSIMANCEAIATKDNRTIQ